MKYAEEWIKEHQEVTAKLHKLCSTLEHVLQEARLSLDREEPNVEMALKRIRQGESAVRGAMP